MFVRATYSLPFSRRDDLQNTGQFDPAIENLRNVWTFIFEAAGSKVEGVFHTITDFTLLHVVSRNSVQITDVIIHCSHHLSSHWLKAYS